MLKEYIINIFGKKQENKSSSDVEDIPDELPPLLEEELKQQPLLLNREDTKIGIHDKYDKIYDGDNSLEAIKRHLDEKSKRIRNTQTNVERSSKQVSKSIIEKEKKEKQVEIVKDRLNKAMREGFFSTLTSLVKEGSFSESLLDENFLNRMRDYWYIKKIEGTTKVDDREILVRKIIDELYQLQNLEQDWKARKDLIEENRKVLEAKEREIKDKVIGLSEKTKLLKYYESVPAEHYFKLANNIIIKDVYQLLNVLKVIDESTFNHHVNHSKNDFAKWVIEVIKDNELGIELKIYGTKEQMIKVLESKFKNSMQKLDSTSRDNTTRKIPIISEENYFKLKDGRNIRDINELIIALKDMDDETYYYHVNEIKNDFSKWIRDVLRNSYIAEKIKNAKNKNEIVTMLEVYF